MIHFGATIYALRKSRYLTQEQLAEQLDVSAVTISKWERGETMPSLELLCKLADYFEISVDEFLGRQQPVTVAGGKNSAYSDSKISDFELGLKLLDYCELARREGYLALEPAIKGDKPDAFLEFAITYVLDCLRKGLTVEQIGEYLQNYAMAETAEGTACNGNRCKMINAVLLSILSGESPEVLQELIASYLGKELRSKFIKNEENQLFREEILASYAGKTCTVPLLEELENTEDTVLRTVIRNIDNATLATALSGASGKICVRFLKNLSERLLGFLHEDIQAVQAEEKEIREAQRRVLAFVKMI